MILKERNYMISNYKKLLEIKDELNSLNKNAFKEGIDIKLNRVEENYNKAIELNCNYILSRSNYKVFKALNRYNKKKENQNEDQTNRGFINII